MNPNMNVARPIEVTRERLAEMFEYSPTSGELRWKARSPSDFDNAAFAKSWNARYAGKLAGSKLHKKSGTSYVQVAAIGRNLKAHRLIWLLVHGEIDDSLVIDHINGDGLDNRLCNLRLVTQADNARNKALSSRSRSGVVGVYWNSAEKKWHARVQVSGVRKSIGQYDRIEDAKAARKLHQAEQDYHNLHGLTREARSNF